MNAVVFTRYGSPDVLELRDVPVPVPRRNEVLVRVHAVSINDWDWGAMHGDSLVNRLIFGPVRPKKQILGSDIAGVVEAIGPSVSRFRVGDEVYGDLSGTWGGFAEYVRAREPALLRKPPSMTFEQAAAIPQAGLLALQGLRAARLQPGQTLLINGAGGGAGTFAIQLARVLGASEITAVDSAAKLDLMRSVGADHVLDYAREDFTKTGRKYDVILDVKTTRSFRACARALKPNGTFVTMGGEMSRFFGNVPWLAWNAMTSKKRMRVLMLKVNEGLGDLGELFEAGKLRPVIDGPYPLRETAAAFRRFAAGTHLGKIVITVAEPPAAART